MVNSTHLLYIAVISVLIVIPCFCLLIYYCQKKKIKASSHQVFQDLETKTCLNHSLNHNNHSKTLNEFKLYVKQEFASGHLQSQEEFLNETGLNDDDLLSNVSATFKKEDCYLILNVPKLEHINKFWNLIWRNHVEHIVLLKQPNMTNYWPAVNSVLPCKEMKIECTREEIFTDYEYRELTLIRSKGNRLVHQLCFPSWSDDNLPNALMMVNFFKKLLNIELKSKSPIVIHCSTGLGGAGFVVLCDSGLRTAKKGKTIDIVKKSKTLTKFNSGLMENYKFYQLAHLVILECLFAANIDINVHLNFVHSDKLSSKEEFNKFVSYMQETLWLDQIPIDQQTTSKNSSINEPNNRNTDLSLFNGVEIQDTSSLNNFILINEVHPKNITHFWNLVAKKNISVVIFLNISKYIKFRQHNITSYQTYDLKIVYVNHMVDNQKVTRKINVVLMKKWPAENPSSPNIPDFVQFFTESYGLIKASDSVLLVCENGVKVSGLFVAMTIVIDKIEKENTWNVCTAARLVRQCCKNFLTNVEEFRFLWEAARVYIEQYQLYMTPAQDNS